MEILYKTLKTLTLKRRKFPIKQFKSEIPNSTLLSAKKPVSIMTQSHPTEP